MISRIKSRRVVFGWYHDEINGERFCLFEGPLTGNNVTSHEPNLNL